MKFVEFENIATNLRFVLNNLFILVSFENVTKTYTSEEMNVKGVLFTSGKLYDN